MHLLGGVDTLSCLPMIFSAYPPYVRESSGQARCNYAVVRAERGRLAGKTPVMVVDVKQVVAVAATQLAHPARFPGHQKGFQAL